MMKILSTFVAVALVGPAALAFADGSAEPGVKDAGQAIKHLERADPGLTRLFDSAAGYAVFATVGKGAVGVGGAHGTGVLYEKGNAVGMPASRS